MPLKILDKWGSEQTSLQRRRDVKRSRHWRALERMTAICFSGRLESASWGSPERGTGALRIVPLPPTVAKRSDVLSTGW